MRVSPVVLAESQQVRLQRLYLGAVYKSAVRTLSVPRPLAADDGRTPLRDLALLEWTKTLLEAVLPPVRAAG